MSMPSMKRTVAGSFDEVRGKVVEALATEGFGVLTEINVRDTLKKKLEVDFRPYTILGACNPTLAHRALQNDLDIGVLLPCNVTVYEGDGGETVVSMVDPVRAIGAFGGDDLQALAQDVQVRLRRVLESLP